MKFLLALLASVVGVEAATMTNVPISGLPSTNAVTEIALVPIVQSGTTLQTTTSNLFTLRTAYRTFRVTGQPIVSISTNIVVLAGSNNVPVYEQGYIRITSNQTDPLESNIYLGSGADPGATMMLQNTADNLGFTLLNGSPLWDDPLQFVTLKGGSWVSVNKGDTIEVVKTPYGWSEKGRWWGTAAITTGDTLWAMTNGVMFTVPQVVTNGWEFRQSGAAQLTIGTNGALAIGAGATNVVERDGSNVGYTNGVTEAKWFVQNGAGRRLLLGFNPANAGYIGTGGNYPLVLDNTTAEVTLFTDQFIPLSDGGVSGGGPIASSWWQDWGWKGKTYWAGNGELGTGPNYSRTATYASNGVFVVDFQNLGSGTPFSSFSFRSNGVEVATLPGSGGAGIVGTLVNTNGAATDGAVMVASGVSGTNTVPSLLNWTNNTAYRSLSWPAFYHTPHWSITERWTANGDGTTNDVIAIGFNDLAGSLEIAGKQSLALHLENDYLGQCEMHWDYTDTNGISIRPGEWFNPKLNGSGVAGGTILDSWTMTRPYTNAQTLFSIGAVGITAQSDRAYTNGASAWTIGDDGTQVNWSRSGGKPASILMRTGWGDVYVPGVDFKTTLTEFQSVPAYGTTGTGGKVGINGNGAALASGLFLSSDVQLAFSTATNLYSSSGNVDTGLAKDSAGVVRISNGSTGTGSLRVNDIFGSRVKVLTSTTAASVFYVSVPNTNAIGGDLIWTVTATDGTETQQQTGRQMFGAVAKGTAVTAQVDPPRTNTAAVSSGTLTVAFNANVATNNVFALQATATTSLTTTNLVIKWRLETPSTYTVNAL